MPKFAMLFHWYSQSFVLYLFLLPHPIINSAKVSWAVNCGGSAHVDVNGISYLPDTLNVGIASDYGSSFTINRVPTEDQILYQTERYNTANFFYTVPYTEDGDYVLSLKFSEVWFAERNQKVFHVKLNKEILIIEHLDIFGEVGFATALEKHIPIRIFNRVLYHGDESTLLTENSFTVDFIKTNSDNPKINAIVLSKGSLADIPMLPPLEEPQEDRVPTKYRLEDQVESDTEERRRPPGVPRAPDPYATTDSFYYLLPVLGSLAAFLPVLICLCKI